MSKPETAEPAAATAGGAILTAVVGLTVDGLYWQLAFTFMAGFLAALSTLLIIQPIFWGKIHRDVRKLKTQTDELVAWAAAEGYCRALRDMQDATSGGDGDDQHR
jgi:hypothetical protein